MKRFIQTFLIAFLLVGSMAACQSIPSESPTPTEPTLMYTIPSTFEPSATASPDYLEFLSGVDGGNQILAALENYHAAHQAYPESLDDLVPDYLDVLPVTSCGQAYRFRLLTPSEGNLQREFLLSFDLTLQKNVRCVYFPIDQEWDCGPSFVP